MSQPPRLHLLRYRWPQLLTRLLLPSHCALCQAGCDGVVCAACREHYAAPRLARCARCANPLPPSPDTHLETSFPRRRESKFRELVCGPCLTNPPAFDATIAAVDYTTPLDQLVLQLKFSARLPLAAWFADLIRDAVLRHPGLPLPELLCPVPLGGARLVERGFNQALEIARPLSKALGVPVHARLAERTLETRAQSGVTPSERADNIRGAFGLVEPDLVAGRHVGLVDDVMTSGHTLGELAATCKRYGAARVTNLVFARTPPHA